MSKIPHLCALEAFDAVTQDSFAHLSTAVARVKNRNHKASITLSLSASLATKWLVSRLPDFRKQHPDISIYLDTDDRLVDFGNSYVDVALRFGTPDWPGLYWECLSQETMIMVAASSLVKDAKLPLRPDQIMALPHLYDHYHSSWDEWFKRVRIDDHQDQRAQLGFSDSSAMMAAVIDGQGIAFVRRVLAVDDLNAGRILRLEERELSLNQGLYWVCRSGEESRQSLRLFRHWLMSQVKHP